MGHNLMEINENIHTKRRQDENEERKHLYMIDRQDTPFHEELMEKQREKYLNSPSFVLNKKPGIAKTPSYIQVIRGVTPQKNINETTEVMTENRGTTPTYSVTKTPEFVKVLQTRPPVYSQEERRVVTTPTFVKCQLRFQSPQ